LRDQFETLLRQRIPHATINGVSVARLPNTSSVTIHGLDAAAAVEELARGGVCIASGAACASGSLAPSHVLVAMGLDHSHAKATLRISLSRETTPAEVDFAVDAIAHLVS
jgi:cysteine desulfurase